MKIKGKDVQKRVVAILLVIAICVSTFVSYNPYIYAADVSTGVVEGTNILNVRSGPGTSYSKVTSINEGDVVSILKVDYDDSGAAWYQICTQDGIEGWVSATYIAVKTEITSPIFVPKRKPITFLIFA